ncbi:MAG: tRNA (adenosine(37)-N6)-threonylcarbamoyltransferase complex dimerization subunit type 1 TsaB [Bacteroidota bacterium]|nr:tRNA (adenosine(37)-N6)-threonylcarbamoyltransferase complex dimerization subunit type 1 TsaB [Bacteroidota bacterium]
MAKILNIESSGDVCSVGLSIDGKVSVLKERTERNIHSKLLTVFIEELFQESSLTIEEIDAVAVSKGPGSYTGLRIGVSAAKGIAYGRDIPLISVSTLKSMAWGMQQQLKSEGTTEENLLLCPMIDARRMEVYSAFYDLDFIKHKDISADIIDENSYADFLEKKTLIFFGDGAGKCREVLTHQKARFRNDVLPSATYMAQFAEDKFNAGDFEDTAYFEPFYLKDFVAKVSTKNIYG